MVTSVPLMYKDYVQYFMELLKNRTFGETDFLLKPISHTQWNCQQNSVKVIRLHLDKVKETLEEFSQITEDHNRMSYLGGKQKLNLNL